MRSGGPCGRPPVGETCTSRGHGHPQGAPLHTQPPLPLRETILVPGSSVPTHHSTPNRPCPYAKPDRVRFVSQIPTLESLIPIETFL